MRSETYEGDGENAFANANHSKKSIVFTNESAIEALESAF